MLKHQLIRLIFGVLSIIWFAPSIIWARVVQLQNHYWKDEKKHHESIIVAQSEFDARNKQIVFSNGDCYVKAKTILEIDPNKWLRQGAVLIGDRKYVGKYYQVVEKSFDFILENKNEKKKVRVVVDDTPPKIAFHLLGAVHWRDDTSTKLRSFAQNKKNIRTVFIKQTTEKQIFIQDTQVGLKRCELVLNDKVLDFNLDDLGASLIFVQKTNHLKICAEDKLGNCALAEFNIVLYDKKPLMSLLIDNKRVLNTKKQTFTWHGKAITVSLYKIVDEVPIQIYYCLENLHIDIQPHLLVKRNFKLWTRSLKIKNRNIFSTTRWIKLVTLVLCTH